MRDQIDKDLQRTNAEHQFFQEENTVFALKDVLVVWTGKNPDVEYVQGMNEIAALIYFVLSENSLPAAPPDNAVLTRYYAQDNYNSDENLIRFLNDAAYVKAETYAIFTRLMKLGVKQLYNESPFRNPKTESRAVSGETFFSSSFDVAKYSLFCCHCYRIFTVMLKLLAPELYVSLRSKSIEPPAVLLYALLLPLDDGCVASYPANSA